MLIAMKSNQRSRFEELVESRRKKRLVARRREREKKRATTAGGIVVIWLENEVRIIWTNSANELVFVELIGRINPIES